LTNRPCADLVRGRPLVRDAQTSAPGSRAGVRLGPVRVPRTMLPGGCGPRRVAPVRRAGRSASTLPLNRPPRPGWPSRAADGYRGVAYEHRWQADALGRGRGRPLSGGQGLEPAPPAARTCPRVARLCTLVRPISERPGPRQGTKARPCPLTQICQRPAAPFCYTPGSHRGRYHTDRQPGDAAQYTRQVPRRAAAAGSDRRRATGALIERGHAGQAVGGGRVSL
jgi:hypothetical protein